jgi:glycosyltransferase involved in cell wall biosynthesis
MDLLVSASYAEGIPRNVMEAFALGKPVVGTDVRGTREIVKDNQTGLLVPMKDPIRLAEAIERVLTDDDLAARLGKAARKLAEEECNERRYFRRTDRFYRDLLRRKRPGVDWEKELKPIPSS